MVYFNLEIGIQAQWAEEYGNGFLSPFILFGDEAQIGYFKNIYIDIDI